MRFFDIGFTEVSNSKGNKRKAFKGIASWSCDHIVSFQRTGHQASFPILLLCLDRADSEEGLSYNNVALDKEKMGVEQSSGMNLHGCYFFHRRETEAERSLVFFTTFHFPETGEVKQVKYLLSSKKSKDSQMGHRGYTFVSMVTRKPRPSSPSSWCPVRSAGRGEENGESCPRMGPSSRVRGQESPATQGLAPS